MGYAFAGCFGNFGNVTTELSADTMMQAAREETGLADFGDDGFIRPLEKLVQETNDHADLIAPEAGTGPRIRSALADRLKLEQYFKDHPKAAKEVITPASAIIGLPRTGSTMVHRLLASSPKMTALFWWETAFPFPLPDGKPGDPALRQEAAKGFVDYLLNEWPDFESIGPMEAMAVNEEVVLVDQYSADQFGLTPEGIARDFTFYHDKYLPAEN